MSQLDPATNPLNTTEQQRRLTKAADMQAYLHGLRPNQTLTVLVEDVPTEVILVRKGRQTLRVKKDGEAFTVTTDEVQIPSAPRAA